MEDFDMNNYIKPTTDITKVDLHNTLLAGSIEVGDPGSANDAEAKGGFLWDEDDDDDPMGVPGYNVWEE